VLHPAIGGIRAEGDVALSAIVAGSCRCRPTRGPCTPAPPAPTSARSPPGDSVNLRCCAHLARPSRDISLTKADKRSSPDRGNRMSPSHAAKGGRRWRYYVSQAVLPQRNKRRRLLASALTHLQGHKHEAGSVARVPALDIEPEVAEAARASNHRPPRMLSDTSLPSPLRSCRAGVRVLDGATTRRRFGFRKRRALNRGCLHGPTRLKLREGLTCIEEHCLLTRSSLVTTHDHIDVERVEFDATTDAARLVSGN
jgi:hypothetical protein